MSPASMFTDKVLAGFLFLGGTIALQTMYVLSAHRLLIPVRSGNHPEVRDAFCGARTGVFGRRKCIQMDEGGLGGLLLG